MKSLLAIFSVLVIGCSAQAGQESKPPEVVHPVDEACHCKVELELKWVAGTLCPAEYPVSRGHGRSKSSGQVVSGCQKLVHKCDCAH
jgi:hypothetical protein